MKIETSKKKDTKLAPVKELKPSDSHPSIFNVKLPSAGKLYGGRDSVDVKLFTVADIKKMYDVTRGDSRESTDRLIGSKIVNFDYRQLTINDLWFITYWLRINSYANNPMTSKWTCYRTLDGGKTCGTVNISSITGSTLEIINIDENFSEPVTLTLPNFGDIQLQLSRVGDSWSLLSTIEKMLGDKLTDGDRWIAKLATMILPGKDLYENYKTIQNKFSVDDVSYLEAFDNEFSYGVGDHVNLKCSGCQEVSPVKFRLHSIHFFPGIQHTNAIRNAVRFGHAHETPASGVPGDGVQ